jgi:hypothetical protein
MTLMPAVVVLLAVVAFVPARVVAQGDRPVVHPIYAQIQDAPQNNLAFQRFNAATRRFGLGPVEIVDIEGDLTSKIAEKTAEKVRAGIDLVRKLELTTGQTPLDEAAADVAATGGAGLDAATLSDLFLYRAWAVSRADFNTAHVPASTARAQAYVDLARAAALTPGRQLNQQQFPPVILEDWTRAVIDVRARPQTTLTVRAAPEALVSCDGGPPVSGPATFVGVAQGEHLIRIEEPGWAAWGGTIAVEGPTVELQVPARRALTLDDKAAAAHARRMGAKFALVAEPRPGQAGGLSVSLRLVDATGIRRDAAIEPIAGDPGALDSAVMRLDEQARRLDRAGAAPSLASARAAESDALADSLAAPLPPPVLVAAPPARPHLRTDPAGWARDHWPLLAAAGAMVGAAVILSIGVASDRPTR